MSEPTATELYTAYRDKVLGYLAARTECQEDAEDLCQSVFAEVVRCLPQYDPAKAALSTWVYQITRFTLIDYLRTKRPQDALTEELAAAGDLEEAAIRQDVLEHLAQALRELEREERDVIILRYHRGLPLTEVARITGISYGMVKVKHRAALQKLRQRLDAS